MLYIAPDVHKHIVCTVRIYSIYISLRSDESQKSEIQISEDDSVEAQHAVIPW